MYYLRRLKPLCVHYSDVTLTGLDELCISVVLWLCLTTLHFIPTCSAPDMVWTWHVCSSACMHGIVSQVALTLVAFNVQ